MSRHEGVSCDSCMKANFRGRRYKCLVCYDYDLCSSCYEAGATTTRHTADHAMQCILTRSDFDLYYGGEAVSAEQPQSFVCPYCGKMGYTDTTLQEHVAADHPESPAEVVCPICAALPGGDPNHVTDDFAAHLQLEHRAPRDFEEPMGIRHVRRIPHPASRGGARNRRTTNMQFHTTSGGTGSTLAGLAPRETMDPIAELLSQLSSVRSRAAAAQSVSSQLQQLEMQLQSTRQQLERLPRRPAESKASSNPMASATTQQTTLLDYAGAVISAGGQTKSSNLDSNYLLSKIGYPDLSEIEKQNQEAERADRSIFLQELLLSSMSETLRLSDDSMSNSSLSDCEEGIVNSNDDADIGDQFATSGCDEKSQSGCPSTKGKDKNNSEGGGGGKSSGKHSANAGGSQAKDPSSNSSNPKSGLENSNPNSTASPLSSNVNNSSNSNSLSAGESNPAAAMSLSTTSSSSSMTASAASASCMSKEKRLGGKVKPMDGATSNLEKEPPPATANTPVVKQ